MAIGLEGTGRVKEPVTNSTDPRADFVDGNNQPWDVKGFLTHPDPKPYLQSHDGREKDPG